MAATRWCVCVLAAVLLGISACSEGDALDTGSSGATAIAGPDASLAPSSATSVINVLSLQEVEPVFRDLAGSMARVPLFGVRSLPEGVKVAETWWPVVEGPDGALGERSDVNPRVVGEGGDEAEGQVVLSSGTGWLVVLENFRGDLGDVTGEAVGSVSGQRAFLYEVNGGWLVQWAFEGRWYGVFGRNVSVETVKALAIEMSLLKGD